MSQEGPPRARPGRHIVITNTALMHFWEFASQGASAHIPKDRWRMSMGLFVCRRWENTYRVEDAFGMAHGTLTTVELPPEAYATIAELDERESQRGRFISSWFHTRPGRGVYLSDIDAKTQLGYQHPDPDSFALVFDHTAMGPTCSGFSMHRLDNTAVPLAELTSHDVLDFSLEGLTLTSLKQAVNLLQNPRFPVDSLWEAIKSRVSNTLPPPLPEIHRPEPGRPRQTGEKSIPVAKAKNLTEKDLAYYRKMWGFDPVNDQVKMKVDGYYYYEIRLPLEYDPVLNRAGVQLIARVEVDYDGAPHNRLGFERGGNVSWVECIHTAIYDATPEKLAKFSPEDYEELLDTTEGRPAILPPWEHFASLKSFAAGLVGRGIFATLFDPPTISLSEGNTIDGNFGVHGGGLGGLDEPLINALYEVAPEIVKDQVAERVGEIIKIAPEDWIRTHVEPLYIRYKVDLLFNNVIFLASVDNSTKKKLLLLFLELLHSEFAESVHEIAGEFLGQLCQEKFLLGLDPETTKNLIDAISRERDPGDNTGQLEYALASVFYGLLAREDALLCDPVILEKIFFNFEIDEELFIEFANDLSPDFLLKILEVVFQIWEKDGNAFLGNFPFLLMMHFLYYSDNYKLLDYELLKKFILLAPGEWLVDYWPELESTFNLQGTFIDHLGTKKTEDRNIRNKIKKLAVIEKAYKEFFQHKDFDDTKDEEV